MFQNYLHVFTRYTCITNHEKRLTSLLKNLFHIRRKIHVMKEREFVYSISGLILKYLSFRIKLLITDHRGFWIMIFKSSVLRYELIYWMPINLLLRPQQTPLFSKDHIHNLSNLGGNVNQIYLLNDIIMYMYVLKVWW